MNKWFLQRNFKYVFDTYEDLINEIYNKIINDEDFSLELVIDWYYDLDCSDENVFAELFEKMNLEFINKHYDNNDEIIDVLSTATFEEKEKISIWYIENYFEDDGWQLIYGSPENKIINSKSDIEEILNKAIVNNKKMNKYDNMIIIDYQDLRSIINDKMPKTLNEYYLDNRYGKGKEQFDVFALFAGDNFKNDIILRNVYNVQPFNVNDEELFKSFCNHWLGGCYNPENWESNDEYYDEFDASVLDWLCFCGELEAGNYLIRISW